MICNDFLVVKVNCWSYVFNIMKYMWILRNVKNKNIVEKNVWKCAPMIRKWWRHTRKTQPNHEPNSLLSVECWQPIAQQHIGMTINVAIKTYTGKITSYRILIKRKRHRLSWYDVTHDDSFRRIAILNRPLKLFFLAFYRVIYQNLLHRRVYIAISS